MLHKVESNIFCLGTVLHDADNVHCSGAVHAGSATRQVTEPSCAELLITLWEVINKL